MKGVPSGRRARAPVGGYSPAVEPGALTARQERILIAACRDYLVMGRPVSSDGLRRAHGFSWSSATIRSELATLERLGYLRRTHASSGRAPNARALERYVQSLPSGVRPDPELVRAVDRTVGEAGADPQVGMRAAVRLLSQVFDCVAVSLVGTSRAGRIREIELVPLVGAQALIFVGLEDGSRTVHTVALDGLGGSSATDRRVARLADRLGELCVGRTLPEARDQLHAVLREHEARLDSLLAEAVRIGLVLCSGAELDPTWVQIAGRTTFAGKSSAKETLAEVLDLLEDDHRLAELLCQVLPEAEPDGVPPVRVRLGRPALLAGTRAPAQRGPNADSDPGVGVGVGAGTDPGPLLHAPTVALVGCRIAPDGRRSGALALLGTERMDYEACIPLVQYAAQALALRIGA